MTNSIPNPADYEYEIWFQIKRRDLLSDTTEDVTPSDLQDPGSLLFGFRTLEDAEWTVENLLEVTSAIEHLVREDDWPDEDRTIVRFRKSDLFEDTNLTPEQINQLSENDIDQLVMKMEDLYYDRSYRHHVQLAVNELLKSKESTGADDHDPLAA